MVDVINKQNIIDQINALSVDGEFNQKDVNYLINYLVANGDLTGTPRDMIQVRRGNVVNLPTLAQGELAVTLDEEKLYFGGQNGNVSVLNKKDLDDQKADNALTPESYTGNDLQKVQSAINDAVLQRKAVKFAKMYDITGLGSIVFNKPATNRQILHLIGHGGGIKKTDAGYMFTSTSMDTGDIVSDNMKYESVSGSGTIAWHGDKIIRLILSKDSYVNVDSVFSSPTNIAQSIRIMGCTIVGNMGWAIEFLRSFDVSIENNTIEHGMSGIRNIGFGGDPDNNTLRIVNNVIEGMSGKGILLGSSFGVTISGNYMEANAGGYIDLSGSTNSHNGLILEGNTTQQTTAQLSAKVPFITLGKIGNNGVRSSGNVATGVLYQLVHSTTAGVIDSVSDISYSGEKTLGQIGQFSDHGKVTANATSTEYGRVKNTTMSSVSFPFTTGETRVVSVVTGVVITDKDILSVCLTGMTAHESVTLLNWYVSNYNTGTLSVRIKNDDTAQSLVVKCNVMQIII